MNERIQHFNIPRMELYSLQLLNSYITVNLHANSTFVSVAKIWGKFVVVVQSKLRSSIHSTGYKMFSKRMDFHVGNCEKLHHSLQSDFRLVLSLYNVKTETWFG